MSEPTKQPKSGQSAPTIRELLSAESPETFRVLVDSVQDYAIFFLSPDGIVASWNTGAERIKGYRADEIIGKHFSVFYTPDALVKDWPAEELRRSVQMGRFEDEGWRVRKDGTRLWANVIISPVRDQHGNLLGFSKVTRDLTERRRVEELELEGRRISEFIATLSHELRNPLAPMRNALNVMGRLPMESQAAWCLQITNRQLDHLTHLVDDLLDVSRFVSGKIRLALAPVEMSSVVQMAVDATRALLEDRGHALTIELPGRPVHVKGDAIRMTQVLVNLLSNAAKYTPGSGRIKVAVSVDAQSAILQVVDNGIGMSEKLKTQAFEPFVQGANALERANGGLGIGLTLVKKIVELHEGSVRAESEGADKGTTFVVTLPIAQAPKALTTPAKALPEPTPKRILVVDDNRDAADSLAMFLRMDGHEVHATYDGARAVAMAATLVPDVILLDIGMPGMNGLEAARQLRALPSLARTRLVAITGFGQQADRDATLAAGFDQHVTKPVNTAALAGLLD
ncbi:MAG TPA: ATP-binding protein [Burkholderiaceae bacterium]|nr:ATP-binding protein [Burkholderiaceae bacterium]